MAATFTNITSNNGFDSSVNPPWQMVPEGGIRTIYLIDGAGLVVTSNKPLRASVLEVPVGITPLLNARQFIVMGLAKGGAMITAGPAGGAATASLEVTVKGLKRVRTTFHLVKDSATPPHSTRRTRADVDTLLTFANRILVAQSNVRIDKHDVRVTTVAGNLRRVVRFSSHLPGVAASQHEWDIVVSHRDNSADFNLFFVWEYEQDRTPYSDDANAGTIALEMNCLMEDRIAVPGRTMAHETVHALGVADHTNDATNLMSAAPRTAGLGEQMNRAQIDVINP
jgi:hypothetical protein